jgi:hypothetical protein
MAVPTVPRPQVAELAAIHAAVCRYRRQGLVCSTCTALGVA